MIEQEQHKSSEKLVEVKSVESELIALQSFILKHLPSDITDDYDFPDSTSKKTIRNVMRIIHESNERFMNRVRRSIAIMEANKKIAAPMQTDNGLIDELKKIKSLCDGNKDSENSIWYICNRLISKHEPKVNEYVRKDLAIEFATRFYQIMVSARVDEYVGARKDVCVNDLFEEFLKSKSDERP